MARYNIKDILLMKTLVKMRFAKRLCQTAISNMHVVSDNGRATFQFQILDQTDSHDPDDQTFEKNKAT